MVQVFDRIIMAEDIRDQVAFDSLVVDHRDTIKTSIFMVNTLNQSVDCQLKVSGDKGVTWQDVGSPVNLAATTGVDWIINSEAYPLLKVEATATADPTSGTLTMTANQQK